MNGKQGGDPVKLARALVTVTELEEPPLRFIAGSDAIAQAEEKLAERQQQIERPSRPVHLAGLHRRQQQHR